MFGPCLIFFVSSFVIGNTQDFYWYHDWGRCERDTTQCCNQCVQRTEVYCADKEKSNKWVPNRYCDGDKPAGGTRSCLESECVQDCVTGEWSQWSVCSRTCGDLGFEVRRRSVLQGPVRGRSCPDLIQTTTCRNVSVLPPCPGSDTTEPPVAIIFRWRLGSWSTCQNFTGAADCGLGLRERIVNCVASNGSLVDEINCKGNPREPTPTNVQTCNLPCDCQVSSWSEWSNCSIACIANRTLFISSGSANGSDVDLTGPSPDDPHRQRMRTVSRSSKFGGEGCPHLQELRSCDLDELPDCPSYQWLTGPFEACEVESPGDVCGFGTQRRTVICSEVFSNFTGELDPNHPAVSDGFCTGEQTLDGAPPASNPVKPVTFRSCYIPCPEDCQLGQWGAFSTCSKSCGEGGIRTRTRPILAEAKNGGQECEATVGTSVCESINCTFWFVSEFSACFLNPGQSCGSGKRHRNVDCVNALGVSINISECQYLGPTPPIDDECYVPCPIDCVLSLWTTWSHCPLDCEPTTQTRSRAVKENATDGNGGKCVDKDELTQNRQCNNDLIPCIANIWRTEPWGICQSPNNNSAVCGEDVGEQVRKVFCVQQFLGHGEQEGSDCDKNHMPPTNRSCTIDCPVDCIMSDWSSWLECSVTCGGGTRSRSRFITQRAAFGGSECPEDIDGIITTTGNCSNNPCYDYEWETGDWSNCTLFFLNDKCGPGFQTRSVDCKRSDDTVVSSGVCSVSLFVAEPTNQQNCYIACADECIFDSWSSFGPCSQECGPRAGSRNRTRGVLSGGSTVTDFEDQCPHIQESDLIEIEPCNDRICLDYNWVTTDWFSCIMISGDCGPGSQSRYIQCQRSDGVAVSPSLCVEARPAISQECNISCPVDCSVTPWSEYSKCCGVGLRSRVRSIIANDSDGGRSCSFVHLEQSSPCVSQCRWDIGDWGRCSLPAGGSCGSGNGTQSRNVTCQIDGSDASDSVCSSVAVKPINQTDCDVPCSPRDCAFSEWSEWGDCLLNDPSFPENAHCFDEVSKQQRTRTQYQGGIGCGSETDEQFCRFPKCLTYSWAVGSWGNCMLESTTTSGCPPGIRRRQVVCQLESGPVIVDPTACDQTNKPMEVMNCTLPCTTNCDVSDWSSFSSCSATCGQGVHVRTRRVLAASRDGGRSCPSLSETKACAANVLPCYNYTIFRSEWSECSARDNICGVGQRTRIVRCLQHDGEEASQFACCLNDHCQDIEGTDEEDILRDIHTLEECRVECPGACQWSEWSAWSPCVKNCSAEGNNGTQTRSRGILVPGLEGSLPCFGEFLDNRTCNSSSCFIYRWVTGNWTEHDNRTVDCYQFLGEEMIRKVDGGCDPNTKPPTIQGCPPCEDDNMVCDENMAPFQCVCRTGYEKDHLTDFKTCFPQDGCLSKGHCPLEYTECNTTSSMCDCESGHSIPPGTTDEENCTVHYCIDPPCGEKEECNTVVGVCEFVCQDNEDCQENEVCRIGTCICERGLQNGVCAAPLEGGDDGDDPPYWAWIILAVGVVLILFIIFLIIVCRRQRGYKSHTFPRRQSFTTMDHLNPTATTESTTWMQDPNPRPYSHQPSDDDSIHKAPLDFNTETAETDLGARRASPSDDSDLDMKKPMYDTDTDAEFGRYDAVLGKRNF